MVPRTLRAALARQPLPPWLCEATGLPDGATVGSLEPELDCYRLERLGHRIELYFCRLLDSNRASVRRARVIDRPWPADLDPASVRWPPRTRRLPVADLTADPATLAALTYGELFALPRVGARAVFAFAAAVEAAVDRASADRSPPGELAELARRVAESPWEPLVSGDDPRFTDLLDHGRGPSWEGSLWRLPELVERVAAIEHEPLDLALRRYVAGLAKVDDVQLDAVLRRLGLDGQPACSLRDAVNGAAVSCERIRQLQNRVLECRPSHPVYMPALERALGHLEAMAPCSAEVAAASLRANGISSVTFHPASVLAAASLCGATSTLELEPAPAGALLLAGRLRAKVPTLVGLVIRQARRIGAANLDALASATAVPTEEAGAIVIHLTDAAFLDPAWVWLPDEVSNRLVRLARRILAVSSPLDVETIHAGVGRAFRRRQAEAVPPARVLRALFEAHPAFAVDARGLVRSVAPLDPEQELPDRDRLFVDVLRSAPGGKLDRVAFRDACCARGMTTSIFALSTVYSPILEHPARGFWCLRGFRAKETPPRRLRTSRRLHTSLLLDPVP